MHIYGEIINKIYIRTLYFYIDVQLIKGTFASLLPLGGR